MARRKPQRVGRPSPDRPARFLDGPLAAVMDGLGHGPEAASAARQAAGILEASAGEPVIALVQRCHDGLRRTRGVVMSLASFTVRDSAMAWIGVGNVETRVAASESGGEPFARTHTCARWRCWVSDAAGPGLGDARRSMQDGYCTGEGVGLGLPSARRLVDGFELVSDSGYGTTVTLK